MVQILPAAKSFGGEFAKAFGGGAGKGFSESHDEARKKKLSDASEKKEVETVKNLIGEDTSGMSSEFRKAYVIQKLKGQGKEDLFNKKQDWFNNKFGTNQGKPTTGDQLRAGENPDMIEGNAGNGVQEPNGFDTGDISDQDILEATIMDSNIGKALGHSKDVSLREKREKAKADAKVKENKRKEEIEFHKESQKYDEDLLKQSKIAKNQVETFKTIESAIDSGNIKPASWTNILNKMGPIGELMGTALMNKDQATLSASIPALLEGWKDVFGVRLTDADLKILQDKLPSIGKTPEANKAILNVMKKYAGMTKLRSEIAADIKEKNNGLRPLNYANMIEKRFDDMIKPVKIINPNTGNIIEIPAYELSGAIQAGASLADE